MNWFNSINDLSLSVRALVAVMTAVHLAMARQCLDNKCLCVYQNNKLVADCSNQKLVSLPKDNDSPNVQSLNLSRTDIFELKRNIFSNSDFLNLQKIYIQKVGLEVIDENAFHKLSNLIELDISSNTLKAIPSPSFRSIPKLRSLDMSSNMIESLPNNSFANLTNLKSLSLERNRITFIDDNAFIGLINLESLKLSENHLSNIRSPTLLPLIRVHSLALSGNPWKCDCALRSVRKLLLATARINVVDQPKCNNGQVWTLMGLDSFLCPPVISNSSLSSNLNVNEGSTLRLECSVYMSEEDDYPLTSIHWRWNNVPIYNNSKGCGRDCLIQDQSQQYFLIIETVEKSKKMKVSRLELSSVQTFNSGQYVCSAKNSAGSAQKVYKIDVSGQYPYRKITTASASSESYVNEENKTKENTTDNVVVGLILAIIFGILLIIILLGISIIMFCRRRKRNHSSDQSNGLTDGTELEKLTDNSNNISLKVNPIQKPPRMTFETYNSDKDIPQVWLIKHNMNGNSNLINDQNYAESEYSTQWLFNDNYNDSQIYSDSIIEPDVIHPSAYVRERNVLHVTDLDKLSVHSDGTEV